MKITLEWLGTATFRLTIGDLVLFLDAYMDRVPAAPPVGLRVAAVSLADFVLVGHSHFDHLAGAEVIAANTGAKIIASNESCRVMLERGVPRQRLLPSQGGERHRLADGVTVRVFPSLHACTWVLTGPGSGEEEHGHTGLTQDERAAQPGLVRRITELISSGTEDARIIQDHIRTSAGSFSDGGPLVHLIETPEGRSSTRTRPAAGPASSRTSAPTPQSWRLQEDRMSTASRSRAGWRSSSRWRQSSWARERLSSAITTTGCRRSRTPHSTWDRCASRLPRRRQARH